MFFECGQHDGSLIKREFTDGHHLAQTLLDSGKILGGNGDQAQCKNCGKTNESGGRVFIRYGRRFGSERSGLAIGCDSGFFAKHQVGGIVQTVGTAIAAFDLVRPAASGVIELDADHFAGLGAFG